MNIAYIAGLIEKKVTSSNFACKDCLTLSENLFNENDKISGQFIGNYRTQRPCKSTFNICKHVHEIVEENLNFANFDYQQIYNLISHKISKQIWFENTDFSHDEEH